MSIRKRKPLRMWGGFIDGKLHRTHVDMGFGGWGVQNELLPALFSSRKRAREQYEDVRRMQITEVKP